MKHRRVDLSFDITTTDCYITVWVATDNMLYSGGVDAKYRHTAEAIRKDLVERTHATQATLVHFLEEDARVARFTISERHDYKNVTIHVDRI